MHRFFIKTLDPSSKQVSFDNNDEIHHMADVLRLMPGDEVELFNGQGLLARARLLSISRIVVELELLDYSGPDPLTGPNIVLVCALPKRSKFDDILEKCTELGVNAIWPVMTERTEIAPSKEAVSRMNDRFHKIIISSSKQCQRLWFPVIHPVMKLTAAIDLLAREDSWLYIPWLEGERKPLHDVFPKIDSARSAVQPILPTNIIFFIGPEGDFSPKEAAYAINKGAIPVSLGTSVLRVETAAVAVVAYTRFMLKA